MRGFLSVAGSTDVVRARAARLRRLGIGERAEHPGPVPAIVLLDPDDSAAPSAIRELARDAPVIVVPGDPKPSLDLVWALMSAGASDVVAWDEEVALRSLAARLERWEAVEELVSSATVRSLAVGVSQPWRRVVREIVEIARFTTASVLITGETGTGKEVLTRLVHALDARPDKAEMVVVDCASVMPSLSGSEFFGHEKGAFTGALGTRRGAFELAHKGTLFLDELGELPITIQAELLRAIQERSYRRVGSHEWRHSDFRLVCATNRDLAADVDAGGFRRDLFHRVAEWRCHLPPLRERREDILPLARHFLSQAAPGAPGFDPAVEAFLLLRDYPGNARDLRQLVHRLAHRHTGPGPVTMGAVPEMERVSFGEAVVTPAADRLFDDAARVALAAGATLKRIQHDAAEAAIRVALADAEGRLRGAAELLGVTERALQLRRRAAERRTDGEVIELT